MYSNNGPKKTNSYALKNRRERERAEWAEERARQLRDSTINRVIDHTGLHNTHNISTNTPPFLLWTNGRDSQAPEEPFVSRPPAIGHRAAITTGPVSPVPDSELDVSDVRVSLQEIEDEDEEPEQKGYTADELEVAQILVDMAHGRIPERAATPAPAREPTPARAPTPAPVAAPTPAVAAPAAPSSAAAPSPAAAQAARAARTPSPTAAPRPAPSSSPAAVPVALATPPTPSPIPAPDSALVPTTPNGYGSSPEGSVEYRYVAADDHSDYELRQGSMSPARYRARALRFDSSEDDLTPPRTSAGTAQGNMAVNNARAANLNADADAELTDADISSIAAARRGRNNRAARAGNIAVDAGIHSVASGRVARPAATANRRARARPAAVPASEAAVASEVIDLTEETPEPQLPTTVAPASRPALSPPPRSPSADNGLAAIGSRRARQASPNPARPVARSSRNRSRRAVQPSRAPANPAPAVELQGEPESDSDLLPADGEYFNSRLERRDLARRYRESNGDMRAIRNSHPGSRYRSDPAESNRILLILGDAADRGQIELTKFHASRIRTLREKQAKEEARQRERDREKGLGDPVATRATYRRGGGRSGRGGRGGGAGSGIAV
ncbi:hypothetical protein B0T19DRAFT_395076 [Cercophora scortea]|uniref:Uncharacterized protein n=1 Tax=Cercophora scortea TaxID=314031 RepID=A0AAE0J1X7_9PEZI|nr:hypothetical protein B0T19DRAFT_395076 [Cercophora scortea]